MAETADLAPNRPARAAPRARRAARPSTSDNLEAQVARLQADLKGIAESLARLSEDKVSDVHSVARREVRHLVAEGQQKLGEIQDEFGHVEKQIKDTIRQKPLTAVAGAVAIGFILALLTR